MVLLSCTVSSVLWLRQLIKDRAHFANEFWDISKALFVAPAAYDENDVKKFCTPENLSHAEEICNLIAENTFPTFTDEDTPEDYKSECCEKIEELLTGYIKAKEWKMGQVMNTLRLFFTGNTRGLGISDIIYFIGKDETVRRIRAGLSSL